MWSGQEGRTTNNGAESFHRHFGDLFGYLRSKPSIWHFLRNLKRYNTFKDVKIRSTKAIPLASSETDRLVNLYEAKSLTVRALLYKLSQKNQPKIKKVYTEENGKFGLFVIFSVKKIQRVYYPSFYYLKHL